MNIALFSTLIDRYNRITYTHNYIWGFEYKNNIYMTMTDRSYMAHVCKLDKASRGAGYALRFCPNTQQKLALIPYATLLCSKKYFNELVSASKYNKGEIFEKLVTEFFGQVWKKDSVPFTKDRDIMIDNVSYQIKFQKGTLCNERSLTNLEK